MAERLRFHRQRGKAREPRDRQSFLLALSDALAPLTDLGDVQETAALLIAEHLGVSRAFYFTVEPGGGHFVHVVERDFCRELDAPNMVGRHPQASFGESVFMDLSGGRTVVVADVRCLSALVKPEWHAFVDLRVQAFVATPLVKHGRYVAGLFVLDAVAHDWTTQEIALVEETAERTWATLAHARARTSEIARLRARVISTQEDERRRFARELHDQLGQPITALRLQLEAMSLKAGPDKKFKDQVERTERLLNELDRNIDFLVRDLSPAALEHRGLATALRQLINQWSQRFAVSSGFEFVGVDEPRLSRDTEVNLYRIVQEALHNIVKHARATHVTVMLERHGAQTTIVILDNGRGFDPIASRARRSGFGLLSMRERAALAGGQLDIQSAPARGTSIIVRIPALDPNTDAT